MRAVKAAKLADDAKEQLARGKFQKARELVSAAAELTPGDKQYRVLLKRIQEEETRVAKEAEKQRLAKQRAKAVAPILEQARDAESHGDYERAAWMAENAVAVDIECAEAHEICATPAQCRRATLERRRNRRSDQRDGPERRSRRHRLFAPCSGVWERLSGAVKVDAGRRRGGDGQAAKHRSTARET